MIKNLMYLFFTMLTTLCHVNAQDTTEPRLQTGAAAVVNDEIITFQDVEARIRFVMMTSGIDPSQKQKIFPMVLRSLIDEKLRLQEIHRLKVKPTEEELKSERASFAERLGSNEANLENVLKQNNVPLYTVEAIIRAKATWQKLMIMGFKDRVHVTQSEIDQTLLHLTRARGKNRYSFIEIVQRHDRTPDARKQIEGLLDQIKSGANFEALAQQFSHNPSSAKGGRRENISEQQLPKEYLETFRNVPPGTLLGPIKTSNGYAILALIKVDPANAQEALPSRDEIEHMLFIEHINRVSQSHIKDVYARAFIELRN